MKSLIYKSAILFAICAIIIGISACGNDKEEITTVADAKLGKMEIEIPASLKSKPEVVEYIKGMNTIADEYAMMIENMIEEYGQYKDVEPEDLGMMDRITQTKGMAEVAIKSTEIMAKWAEYQNKRTNIDEQLTDEEIQALDDVWTRFETRIEQIQEKHSEFFATEE